jgi:hypothetical protein
MILCTAIVWMIVYPCRDLTQTLTEVCLTWASSGADHHCVSDGWYWVTYWVAVAL